jgi:hypothetical protein
MKRVLSLSHRMKLVGISAFLAVLLAAPGNARALSLDAQVIFGGAGDQVGYGIAYSGGTVFFAGQDAAVGSTGDGRYGSYNPGLTTQNFNQTLGGNYGEARGIAVGGAAIYVGGSSRPPALTVDNVGGWENKPVVQRTPATGGTPTWTRQVATPPSSDRVFTYSGTEWANDITFANIGGSDPIFVTGGGEDWGVSGHYAGYLSKLDTSGSIQWTVHYGPGVFTTGHGLVELGGNVYVVGDRSGSSWLGGYDGTTGADLFAEKTGYGGGVFYDVTAFGGDLFVAGVSGGDGRLLRLDTNGNVMWDMTYSQADILRGLVGFGGRIYAVGEIGDDAVVIEADAATGSFLSSTLYGGGLDSSAFNNVALDSANGRLYAAGWYSGSGSSGKDILIASYATQAVPEPGSLFLLGTGLMGLALLRLRRS